MTMTSGLLRCKPSPSCMRSSSARKYSLLLIEKIFYLATRTLHNFLIWYCIGRLGCPFLRPSPYRALFTKSIHFSYDSFEWRQMNFQKNIKLLIKKLAMLMKIRLWKEMYESFHSEKRINMMKGWLFCKSHRQRGNLEMAPPFKFTVPCEGMELWWRDTLPFLHWPY